MSGQHGIFLGHQPFDAFGGGLLAGLQAALLSVSSAFRDAHRGSQPPQRDRARRGDHSPGPVTRRSACLAF
jgi:hypothetical protein